MTTQEERFHETWMGMVQPIEGLVVSRPVLLEAQVGVENGAALQERFKTHLVTPKKTHAPLLTDFRALASDLLEIDEQLRVDPPRNDLRVDIPEGNETIRPTWTIRDDVLVWELPPEVDLDKADAREGVFSYPPRAKFDRLLRETRIPIGVMTNQRAIRLVYAPLGESTGSITFRVADMAKSEGRPILDAFVMLLHARRFENAGEGRSLRELLERSRKVQADVSKALEGQVKGALETLLAGFEHAAERDGHALLSDAQHEGTLYQGLLTLLLRLVFVLFAEDQELLPVEHEIYRSGYSLGELYKQLQDDAARYPDAMSRRFGAYGRLVALFRSIFLGARHAKFVMPARLGELFSPHTFPFLEGWGSAGGAPIHLADERAGVVVPSVDDGTIFDVLRGLLFLNRERLSYRALDVEQIGSVYEGLMGYLVVQTKSAALRFDDVWIEAVDLFEQKPAARAKWLEEETGLSTAKCKSIANAVASSKREDDVAGALASLVKDPDDRASAGRLVLQPGKERRRTSSHYTPRNLSEPIVEKTLAPLLKALGAVPTSEQILTLKVCDPAMGSGAFLVAACRYLGKALVSAWTREGKAQALSALHGDIQVYAQRTVAQRCLYGVDKNPFAVSLAKVSLWLATLAKDEAFTFLDHALRCGDSLVGLSLDQIEKFTWEPVKETRRSGQLDLFQDEIAQALKEALKARHDIERLASEGSAESVRERQRLLDDARDALARVRTIGDVIVGAFFAKEKDKERRDELVKRERVVRTWLASGGGVPDDVATWAAAVETIRPFHWAVEFPEVFFFERPDPLEGGERNGAALMDAFVGNPPFSGKNGIIEAGGPSYLPWLQTIHEGAHGNADLVAHFFRRADSLLGKHGTIGLIATKTIAQGDTRASALKPLIAQGLVIYDATRLMFWPGEAAVAVAVVHLAKGNIVPLITTRILDILPVVLINSRLRAGLERPDPVPLPENADKSFQGSIILGMGFTLTPTERNALVKKNKKNEQRIFPFVGGEDVNTSPTQQSERYVISFGQMDLADAAKWPDLLDIVRATVKPERDKQKDVNGKTQWWQFLRTRGELYAAIKTLKRKQCLVTAVYTKHLCFSFQPTDIVFTNKLYVFAFDDFATFATLQSRIHVVWAWLTSSTLKADLAYTPTETFEPFPFPEHAIRLEAPGREFYEARAEYMKRENVGLTITYNRMRDPNETSADVIRLRDLTVAMDLAVLRAYGWSDLKPPRYELPTTDDDKRGLVAFEDAVIDRLFDLNAKRTPKKVPSSPRSTGRA